MKIAAKIVHVRDLAVWVNKAVQAEFWQITKERGWNYYSPRKRTRFIFSEVEALLSVEGQGLEI
ncbi:MAG: hypothetical protein FP831_03345 [Anaerolineae bacterium]|nr:hypothetical protein [Anaerolineae bacterium]